MDAFLDTCLFLWPLLLLYQLYLSWRQHRSYQALRAAHHHVCKTAACVLLVHGQEMVDGKRALLAPANMLEELDHISLNVIIVAADPDADPEHVGLAVSVRNDDPPRRKREPKPLQLEPDVQAALA